ncbi:hypothetical protein Tco_1385040 [Tanacetum coccineum]
MSSMELGLVLDLGCSSWLEKFDFRTVHTAYWRVVDTPDRELINTRSCDELAQIRRIFLVIRSPKLWICVLGNRFVVGVDLCVSHGSLEETWKCDSWGTCTVSNDKRIAGSDPQGYLKYLIDKCYINIEDIKEYESQDHGEPIKDALLNFEFGIMVSSLRSAFCMYSVNTKVSWTCDGCPERCQRSLSKAHLPSLNVDPLLACYIASKLQVPLSVDNPFQPA